MRKAPLLLAVTLTLIPAIARAEEGALAPPLIEGGDPDTRKVTAIEVTPLGLFLGHYGAGVEVVPVAHHALVASAYYLHLNAGDDQFVQLDPKAPAAVPVNHYSGIGGELGYRYYFGTLGPHGNYLGPSLLLGSFSADAAGPTAARTTSAYRNLGGAFDVGYQSIVGGMLVGIGAGVQYVHADASGTAVSGDLYAATTTQSGVRPRVALTLGWAL